MAHISLSSLRALHCSRFLLVLYRSCLYVLALLSTDHLCYGQSAPQRALEHEDYDVWNTISQRIVSRDGNWIAYSVQNGAIDGEATLHIRHANSSKEYVVERGSGLQLSSDSQYAVFRVTPEKSLVKKLRRDGKKGDELPQSKLQILELSSGETISLASVRSFRIPEENSEWVACLLDSDSSATQLKESKSAIRETYEVTESGLQIPSKSIKLKSREELRREREASLNEETIQQPTQPEAEEASQSEEPEKPETDDENNEEREKKAGSPLLLIHLKTGVRRMFPSVTEYRFSKHAETLAFVTSIESAAGESRNEPKEDSVEKDTQKDSPKEETEALARPGDGVHALNLQSLALTSVLEGKGEYKNLAMNESGSMLAFITNRDDWEAKSSSWSVYQWSEKQNAKMIAKEGSVGLPKSWWISPSSTQRYSEDDRRLYFETTPIPDSVLEQRNEEEEKEENEEDEVKLDIWHWQDPQLQPQQLLRADIERQRDYEAAFVFKSKAIVQLETRLAPELEIDLRSKSNYAIANSDVPYRKSLSWDVPGFQNAYLVNLDTGERKLVLEKVKWRTSLSPEGKYLTWFDAEQQKWFAMATSDAPSQAIEISAGIPHPLQNELHDQPSLPRSYGNAGWMAEDLALLIYDQFDIWKLDPTGTSEPECITESYGRDNQIAFRYRPLDREERAIAADQTLILTAFNRKTKASGFYSLAMADAATPQQDEGATEGDESSESSGDASRLRKLIMLDEAIGGLVKAKESDEVIFTRNTFQMCPDIWSSDVEFKRIQRVSDSNPQQDDYRWGSAELIHWNATDGQELDGILLKPDGFDPNKKYPMIVYFYERNSNNLHSYYAPAAGRSIINHSFYVSRGYLIFIPDIPYTTGEPGPSAVNAILPGVEHLVAQGFVDEQRIGTQGHSWGGYQVAYLVTQTDMFACAESGAPVSNMTSAYGGIRWGSGMSRMFQYERTQSRIGEDLWSARDKYIANSPLFEADKINTPLLILHNDEDGAVPWYQGIELFVALRRLEKPAWMLNYNGNPHWVMGEYNRRDFAIRMQQFFDHYLMDAPEPEWMAFGVPAVEKGENYGLELLEPEESNPEE